MWRAVYDRAFDGAMDVLAAGPEHMSSNRKPIVDVTLPAA
jgi:hypothetical protein